jgi:hypothetical protein
MAGKEVEIMSSGSIHLRLEARNGFAAKEYRIKRGSVEVRTFACESDHMRIWSRLTPEQLSTHVKHHTVVARWLEHRLGWRRLLRACVGLEPWIPSGSRAEASEIVKQEQAWV